MVPLSSVSRSSVRLSVHNGCIVGHRGKLFAWIISFVPMLSAYKISGMQCKETFSNVGLNR